MTVRCSIQFDPLAANWGQLAPGLAAPTAYGAEVDDDESPYLVRIEATAEPGRPPECASVTVSRREGGPAVTTSGLRSVRVKDYMAHVTGLVSMRVKVSPEGGVTLEPVDDRAELHGAFLAAHGRLAPDLQRVAEIYTAAVEANEAPTKAVKETLAISMATAQRRVRAARAAGFELPPPPRRPKSEGGDR